MLVGLSPFHSRKVSPTMNFRLLRIVTATLVLSTPACTYSQDIVPEQTLPKSTPWDLAALSQAPKVTWLDAASPVRALLYEGPSFQGKPTSVFAYYATPETLVKNPPRTDNSLPAVVLVHGGGGTAFPQWVKLWAERGYAAIAMDLAGCSAKKVRLPDGGPGQGDDTKFGAIDSSPKDQWSYHAVANVILAHSLVRSLPEVDASKTAITGISWGGYLTCIVAGLDNRFRAAVPVYGCGFLHEGSIWDGRFAKMNEKQRARWVELWDPSRYVGSAKMPVFFVNGTNDFAYWLESYKKTYDLVKSPREFRITVNMPHGHHQGWAPKEIGAFIDSKLLGTAPLPRINRIRTIEGKIEAIFVADQRHEVKSGELHYTTDGPPHKERRWTSKPARVVDVKVAPPKIVVDVPPKDAKIWFLTANDDRGFVSSSSLVFAK